MISLLNYLYFLVNASKTEQFFHIILLEVKFTKTFFMIEDTNEFPSEYQNVLNHDALLILKMINKVFIYIRLAMRPCVLAGLDKF